MTQFVRERPQYEDGSLMICTGINDGAFHVDRYIPPWSLWALNEEWEKNPSEKKTKLNFLYISTWKLVIKFPIIFYPFNVLLFFFC
jgi:hypothetical protein